MIIAIITEGFKNTGFGHITRCTSIYQAFEEKGIYTKFIVNGNSDAGSLLQGTNHEVFNWLNDLEKLFECLKNVDAVIVDSYFADINLYKNISFRIKYPVFIDDFIRLDYPKGVVVNGTILAEKFNYPEKENSTYLLGSKYIPLRKEFRSVPKRIINKNIETVLVTIGGQDIRNLTPGILELLKNSFPHLKKNVVIGCGFDNVEEIERAADENTSLIIAPDAAGMKELMINSDLAVSAAGQTLYELALTGIPTICIGVAENQRENIKGWSESGFIKFAGWWNDKDLLENIRLNMELIWDFDTREKLSGIGQGLVDGLGAKRIADYLIDMANSGEGFYLRRANIADSEDVLKLSNDRVVRQNSISQKEITPAEHNNWFTQKISDKNYDFFVACSNNEFAGQCRFMIEPGKAVISVSIAENFRGKGLSSRIIRKSSEIVLYSRENVNQIFAYIKPENISSIKGFEKAGFVYNSNEMINNEEYLLYILDRKKIN